MSDEQMSSEQIILCVLGVAAAVAMSMGYLIEVLVAVAMIVIGYGAFKFSCWLQDKG